ncbi:unnamed protein product [Cuscuta epithymum]|uniref:AMP-dependent synthetase/ligase domain-containing protein n=1 Tax=Cuscuta epithymum TaxID=186058 RepID=A0AAV0BX99_9ASTE|nr:unnamed protein product [Cuscuta epithymum]CAH9142246.1 unnamed protein product [Cuscuta epithymum]
MAGLNIKSVHFNVLNKNGSNHSLQGLMSHHGFIKMISEQNYWGSRTKKFRVFCKAEIKEIQVRKCSPILESMFLSGNESLQSSEWKAVPDIWNTAAEKFGNQVALVDQYHNPPTNMTYKQLEMEIVNFAEGLRVIGLKPDEKIAIFAENSCRWLVADQGIMTTGAINVVRGSRSSVEELVKIYTHSESVALVVDNPEMYTRVAKALHSRADVRFVILLWGENSSITSEVIDGLPIYSYTEILDFGNDSCRTFLQSQEARHQYLYEPIGSSDVATLVYTSGTTGNPKGVMLTHTNFLHQDDLKHFKPQYLLSVPLVYESLYSEILKQINRSGPTQKLIALFFLKISLTYKEAKRIYEGRCLTKDHKQPSYLISALEWLGTRAIAALLSPLHLLARKLIYSKFHTNIGISKAGLSGGGSLSSHVDKFFEAIDLTIQNGYGLTETSPVVASRHPNCTILGSVGVPARYTEIKVVDVETDNVLPHGSKGIVKVKGPQIMKGYYKNPMATKQAIDENGWLNTGDLGWIVPHHSIGPSRNASGVIVLEGRAKDTIVLSSGENVEPSEIEEAAMSSNLIQHIVVIGQDKRRLGAIVVPHKEEVLSAAKRLFFVDSDATEVSKEKTTNLIHEELKKCTMSCTFKIGPLLIVDEPFTIDNGLLTPTMKVKRDKVADLYKEQTDKLYK